MDAGGDVGALEDAVDAVADDEFVLVGLDVGVGGAFADGLGEEVVDELDDGGFLGLLGVVGLLDLDAAASSPADMASSVSPPTP